MTVKETAERLDLTIFCESDGSREVTGGYAGDLLSWVMSRAHSGDAWITIMSNVNIAAVAALSDVAMIILAEGVTPDKGVSDTASQRGINIYGSQLTTFQLCERVSDLL